VLALFPPDARFELGPPTREQRAAMFEVGRAGTGCRWAVPKLCSSSGSCPASPCQPRAHAPGAWTPPPSQPLMLAAAQPPPPPADAAPPPPPPLPKAPDALAAAEEARERAAAAAARAAWEGEQQVLRLLRIGLRDVTMRLLASRK
jgi:hypothetical protein